MHRYIYTHTHSQEIKTECLGKRSLAACVLIAKQNETTANSQKDVGGDDDDDVDVVIVVVIVVVDREEFAFGFARIQSFVLYIFFSLDVLLSMFCFFVSVFIHVPISYSYKSYVCESVFAAYDCVVCFGFMYLYVVHLKTVRFVIFITGKRFCSMKKLYEFTHTECFCQLLVFALALHARRMEDRWTKKNIYAAFVQNIR